jgi:hypothetical protein
MFLPSFSILSTVDQLLKVSAELKAELKNETDAATGNVPVSFRDTVKVSSDLTKTDRSWDQESK